MASKLQHSPFTFFYPHTQPASALCLYMSLNEEHGEDPWTWSRWITS